MVAKDTRETIVNLLKKMKSLLVVAGIASTHIRMRPGRHQIKTCAKAFDWLHELYISSEYKELEYIYSLRTPEIWKRYKILEIEGLREQVLLEKASKKLLKRWRNKRPALFGKNRKSDKDFKATREQDYCSP